MKQLTYDNSSTLKWWDTPEPIIGGAGEALVRPFIAGRCDGDSVYLRHDYPKMFRAGAALHVVDSDLGSKGLDPFRGPFAYGHECVAEVVEVGGDVRSHRVGDQVIVPWSISCGACSPCSSGLTSKCSSSGQPLTAYGFGASFGGYGGAVSDLLRVPYADAMLVAVPDGVDPVSLASAGDNLSDGYRTVAPHLARWPGAPVLIVGGGARSIGLYAVGIAIALGASRVDYIDHDVERLHRAQRFGAHAFQCSRFERWTKFRRPIPRGGYPITVDASSTSAGLSYAVSALAPGGVCTGVGFYVGRKTPLPVWKMHLNDSTLHVGVSHPRAHLEDVVALVASGRFDPLAIGGLIADWEDAPDALRFNATKVILTRRRVNDTVAC